MSRLALIALCACGSAPPATDKPAPPPPTTPVDAPASPPDTGPPAAVLGAPAFVFRYHTADRSETWTLQQAEGSALLVVERANGTQKYTGTATGDPLALDVSTGTAKLKLECKREKMAVSAKCNDTKAKPIEVLNCYHPDFKSPMSFAPAPGIEYVVEPGCSGFRLRS